MPESATQGNPAPASAASTVVTSEFHPNGGNVVQIRHAGGWYTTYIHLDTRPVIVGQYVPRGYRIGTIGHTGAMSNGVPHLHYEFAGDFDGDGKDGVGVFRPDNGYVYLDNSLDGVADETFRYGAAADRPFSRKRG